MGNIELSPTEQGWINIESGGDPELTSLLMQREAIIDNMAEGDGLDPAAQERYWNIIDVISDYKKANLAKQAEVQQIPKTPQ